MDTDGDDDDVQIPESCNTLDIETEHELLLLPPLLLLLQSNAAAAAAVPTAAVTNVGLGLKPKFSWLNCGLLSPIWLLLSPLEDVVRLRAVAAAATAAAAVTLLPNPIVS